METYTLIIRHFPRRRPTYQLVNESGKLVYETKKRLDAVKRQKELCDEWKPLAA